MLFKCKNNKMRNFFKYNKNKKDYFYYTYFEKYHDLLYLNTIHTAKIDKKLPFVLIDKNNELSKKTKKDIESKNGKPTYKEKSRINKYHQAYFYKVKYYKYDIIKSFHFYNNFLFFINITFNSLSEKDKTKIIEKVKEVYNITCTNITQITIKDAGNNTIYIEDLFNLSFNILLKNSLFLNEIKEKIDDFKNKITVKEDEFLTNLFETLI